jgi:hypothetical protein
MRFELGDNHFRILSKNAVLGWIDWVDKKPVRTKYTTIKPEPVDPKKPVKHFWAFIVWDYKEADADKKIKILEITQAGIQNFITNLTLDEDWGDPISYDLVIKRQGEGLETSYDCMAKPPKPLAEEIAKRFSESKIDLEQLFTGGDPFNSGKPIDSKDLMAGLPDTSRPINADDIPF